MSVSPRKRSGGYPEVVIYTNSPRSKTQAASLARERAAQEEALYAGLTRIEQIRLRARKKAEQEDRERQEAESRPSRRQRTVEYDDDDDDDDELEQLPELDIKKSTRRAITTPLPSSPSAVPASYDSDFDGPLSSLTASTTEHVSSSLSLPSRSQEGPAARVQRSRRTTARVEPYVFRPSLDPISERRRKLKEAQQSAAVQANVIKREDFKKSAYDGKSDAIDKVLRDHRREQRKGLDVDGLYATIKMAKGLSGLMDDQAADLGEEGDQDDCGSGSGDDDTSSASSSRSRSPSAAPKNGRQSVRYEKALTAEEIENERRSFIAMTGEDDDSIEGTEMFNILLKDKEAASKKTQVGQGEDVGMKERAFWKLEKVPLPEVVFPKLPCEHAIYEMLRDASDSGRDDRLVLLLNSAALTEQLESEEEKVAICEVASWLFEVAVLTPTSRLSFAALQALHDFISSDSMMKMDAVKAMLCRLTSILARLGAKDDILAGCSPDVEPTRKKRLSKHSTEKHIRRGERLRAVERLLQVLDLLARTLQLGGSLEVREERTQLFVIVIQLGIDPQHSLLKLQLERVLETLFDVLIKDDPGMDDLLLSKSKTLLLRRQAPTTQLAILSILPSTNLRSRSLQRRLAYNLLTVSSDTIDSVNRNDYSALADILSSPSVGINPLLATKERDYKQVDANVQILCYALNDFALQLLVTGDSPEERIGLKSVLRTVIQNYYNYDDESAKYLQLLLSDNDHSSEGGQELGKPWKISTIQVEGIHRIMDKLATLSGRIQEGKGAFLDRSILKDQMQRLRLMLLYQLTDFGLAGDNSSRELQQGKLSKWFH